MTTAPELAKYVISHYTDTGHPVSNISLQRILYAMSKQYLDMTGEILLPEKFKLWATAGPYLESVYFEYCIFCAMPLQMHYNITLPKHIVLFTDAFLAAHPVVDITTFAKECYNEAQYDNRFMITEKAYRRSVC